MGTQSRGLILPFIAGAAIAAQRILKFHADPGKVAQAAADTDALLGVSTFVPSAVGETCDVQMEGSANVIAGGTVPQGARVTSDAQGRAIVANGTDFYIGTALESAVLNDEFTIHIHKGQL